MKERARDVVRKLRREMAQPKWRRSHTVRWTIGILLTLLVALLFPTPRSLTLSGYSVGSLWTNEDVVAPFSFPINKNIVQYRREVAKALEALYPVYVPDTTARDRSLKKFTSTFEQLVQMVDDADADTIKQIALEDSLKSAALTSDEWQALLQFEWAAGYSTSRRNARAPLHHPLLDLEPRLLKTLNNLVSNVLIARATPESDSFKSTPYISLRVHPSEETLLPPNSVISLEEAQNRIYSDLEAKEHRDPALLRALSKVIGACIVPTVRFDDQLTEESRETLVTRVLRSEGIVREGQRIVARGDIVTPQNKEALESLTEARLERGGVGAQAARIIGTIGHAAIILLLVVLYLRFIRRKIYNDNAQLLLLGVILLFPAILAFLSVRIHLDFPLEYLILIPVASMLLTILFDSRTGFYGTVVSALMVAGIRGNDYSVALAGLAAGAFAAYTVRDLRSRAQLFQSIGYIFLGYCIAIVALSLERSDPFGEMGYKLLAASINAVLSPVITFGLLYLVESIFDTMSDLKLTEYDSLNHPLLKELAMRAPGTYQHTMLVAQLSENAAAAIGANGLLAKVGAYFHDIGKLTEPSDFIENQTMETGNIHSTFSPLESAEHIRRHVVEGIALGHAHNLPEKLLEFIPMHHGTRHISFFYEEALKIDPTTAIPNEALFRYPGPKPATKETAIVMLADASEAVARYVASQEAEPTLAAIEEALDRLIRQRFDEGQLDDCDLTIRDLTIIRAVFARLLVGIHHSRMSYPLPNLSGHTNSKLPNTGGILKNGVTHEEHVA